MMAQNLRIAIAVLAMAISSSPLASGGPAADETELRRLSVRWMQALEAKDEKMLESIVASDYALQFPGDAPTERVPRSEWMHNAIHKDWTRFRYENLEVSLNGDHAQVTSRLYFHVAPIPFELDSGVIDYWQRRDGRWQVTRRYLGESKAQGRIALAMGFLAALVLAGAWFGTRSLIRRFGRRAT